MVPNLKWRLFTIGLICLSLKVNKVDSSQELVKKMSVTFFKAIEECKKELSIPDDVIKTLVQFWREDHEIANRELGCVLLCMATKQDLVELEEYKMHHDKALDFAKDHGADDETAKQIVTIIHNCEKQFEDVKDHCFRVLEVAKCFRTQIHSLKWAPSMEVLIAEILLE